MSEQKYFDRDTVLSVVVDDARLSPAGEDGRVELVEFVTGRKIPEDSTGILIHELFETCRNEILAQHGGFQDFLNIPAPFHQQLMDVSDFPAKIALKPIKKDRQP